MQEITTASTIEQLLIIFSRYGLPVSVRADNGPQFSSEEFRLFCEEQGIRLDSTIPYWPQMNGEVERQNRSILKRLRIAQELGKNWRKELRHYLLTYHSAIHPTTGKSPSELLFGRRLRTKLPCIPVERTVDEDVRDHDRIQKEKGRVYADRCRKARSSSIDIGDLVLAKRSKKDNKLSSDFSPEEFTVTKKQGTDFTIRSTSSGKEFRRSVAHLKRIEHQSENSDVSTEIMPAIQDDPDPISAADSEETPANERSRRTKIESSRLKDFVTY
ncbi:uncharacterized protein LOC129737692 [Uranotaenia lowii]|uniref:uncharacterized protein LOC129737692 n=1 Tax=Uranotaenia lowii TaxID=190385 RepID=UPI00247868DE|nr:uncharacterized protein LOC129737692 [Uranotaenia lowii]